MSNIKSTDYVDKTIVDLKKNKVDKTSIITTAKDKFVNDDQIYSAKAINTELDDAIKNQLQCGGISVTIKNTTTDSEMDDLFNKILSMCNSIMLILMIVPYGVNSTNFESVNQSVLDKIKNKTNALGITIEGVKVHMVTEWNDGNSSKAQITPNTGDEQEWFNNYKTHIMKYAKFCENNKIPRLFLCNENLSLTKNTDLLPHWKNIVDDIHDTYPNVLLSIAMDGYERRLALIRKMNNIANVADVLDFISINTYPSLTDYNPNNAVEESDNILRRFRAVKETVKDIKDLSLWYGKDIIITEIGNTGSTFGLKYPVFTGSNYVKDETIRARYYKVILPVLATIPAVKGIFIWRINDIFSPYGELGGEYLKEFFGNKNSMSIINESYTYDIESTEKSEYVSAACANTVSPWMRVGYIDLNKLKKIGNGNLRLSLDFKSNPSLANIDGTLTYNLSYKDGDFTSHLAVISNNGVDLSGLVKFGFEEANTKSTLYIKNVVIGDIVTVTNVDAFLGEGDYLKRDNETFAFIKPRQLRSWMIDDFVSCPNTRFMPEAKHFQVGIVDTTQTLAIGDNTISFNLVKSSGITTSQTIAKDGLYNIFGTFYIRSTDTLSSPEVFKVTFSLPDGTPILVINAMIMSTNASSYPIHFNILKTIPKGDKINMNINVPSSATTTFRVTTESNIRILEM